MPIPAPSSNIFVDTVEAIPTLKSASSILAESTISSLPSTYRSPRILTVPATSSWGCGSITSSEGPLINPSVIVTAWDSSIPVLKVGEVNVPSTTRSLWITVSPDTTRSSSIRTRSAPRITNSPVAVSIVLLLVTPICTSPMYVPAFISTTPLNVDKPTTEKFLSTAASWRTLTILLLEDNLSSPRSVEIKLGSRSAMPILLAINPKV